MNDKTKLFKKLLTTASVLSLVGISSNALGAAKTTAANPAVFSAAGSWNPGGAIASGDHILIGDNTYRAITADTVRTVLGYDVNGKTANVLVTINAGIAHTTGSISDSANPVGGGTISFLLGGANSSLTLNGTATGAVPGVGVVNANIYDKLSKIDFGAVAPVVGTSNLIINSTNAGAVISLPTVFANGANAAIDAKTNLALTDNTGTLSTLKQITIEAGKYVRLSPAAKLDGGGNAVVTNTNLLAGGNTITFSDAASELHLSSTNGARNIFILQANLDPGNAPGGKGIVNIHASGQTPGGAAASHTILTSNGAKTLGTAANPLALFNPVGGANGASSEIDYQVSVYATIANIEGNAVDFDHPVGGAIITDYNGSLANRANVANVIIGNAAGPASLVFDGVKLVNNKAAVGAPGDASLLVSGSNLTFAHDHSLLHLANTSANANSMTFELANDLTAHVGGGGRILLDTRGANPGAQVVLTSNNAGQARNLGAAGGDKFNNLLATGTGTIVIDENINLGGVDRLDVFKDATLITRGVTTGDIATIHIGSDEGGGAGAATLAISPVRTVDAAGNRTQSTANLLQTVNGVAHTITFQDADATLALTSTGGADNKFVIHDNLDTGAVGKGIIELKANGNVGGTASNLSVVVNSAGIYATAPEMRTLGSNGNILKELRITGGESVTTGYGLHINAEEINIQNGANYTAKDMSYFATGGDRPINIGTAPAGGAVGAATITIDGTDTVAANNANQVAQISGNQINFKHKDSTVRIGGDIATANSLTFKLSSSISGGAGGAGGKIELFTGNGNAGSEVVLDSTGGKVRNLGRAVNQLTSLTVTGTAPARITNLIKVGNLPLLDVKNGANLTVESATIVNTASVNIGEAAGGAHLSLDGASEVAVGGGINLQVDLTGSKLHLANANSSISLGGAIQSANSLIYTLADSLDNNANGGGIVNLYLSKGAADSVARASLILESNNAANVVRLSHAGKQISQLNIIGSSNDAVVTISRTIDLTDVQELNIAKGIATIETKTISAVTGPINIGTAAVAGPLPIAAVQGQLQIGGANEVAVTRAANGGGAAPAGAGDTTIALQTAGQNINFNTADSVLSIGDDLPTPDTLRFTLGHDLKAFQTGNGGVLELYSVSNGAVVLDSDVANTTIHIGSAANKIALVRATGAGSSFISSDIDLKNVVKISAYTGAKLIIQSNNIDASTQLTIGTVAVPGGAGATTGNIEISPAQQLAKGAVVQVDTNIGNVTFNADKAGLGLFSKGGANNNFILHDNIIPAVNNEGILALISMGKDGANNASVLSLQAGAKAITIGSPANGATPAKQIRTLAVYNENNDAINFGNGISIYAKELAVIGKTNLILKDPAIHATTIRVGIGRPTLGINKGPGAITFDTTDAANGNDLEATVGAVALEDAGSRVTFAGAVATGKTTTIGLNGDITTAVPNGGIINLDSTGSGNKSILMLASSDPTVAGGATAGNALTPHHPGALISVGTAGNEIKELNAIGAGINVISQDVDLTHVNVINVDGNAKLDLQNATFFATAGNIANIGSGNIAPVLPNPGQPGVAGILALDGTKLVASARGNAETLGGIVVPPAPGQGDVAVTIENANNINFKAAKSNFVFGAVMKAEDTITFKLAGNIAGWHDANAAAGVHTTGGIITLLTSNPITSEDSNAAASLVLTTNDGVNRRLLGNKAGDKIAALNVQGTAPAIVTNFINLSGVEAINIKENSKLIVQTDTIDDVNTINIGKAESAPGAGDGVAGTLVLDASEEDLGFARAAVANGAAAQVINFNASDSRVVFTNPNGGAVQNLITLGSAFTPDQGIIEFKSAGTGLLGLTGVSVGKSPIQRADQFVVSGTQAGEIDVRVYAKTLAIGSAATNTPYVAGVGGAAATGDVIGNTIFNDAVNLGANGTLIFNNPGRVFFTEDSSVDILNFNGNVDTTKTAVVISDTKTLTIGGQYNGDTKLDNQISFGGADATLAIVNNSDTETTHNVILNTNLIPTVPGQGKILIRTLAGRNSINIRSISNDGNETLGVINSKLKDVTITGNKGLVGLYVDIFANTTNFTDANVKILDDVKIVNTNAVINDSTVNLVNNTLTYNGQVTFTGENTLTTRFGTNAAVYNDAIIQGGNIKLTGANSKFTFAANSTVTLNFSAPRLQNDALIAAVKAGQVSYDVISGNVDGALPTITPLAVAAGTDAVNPNQYISWKNNGFKIIATFNSKAFTTDLNNNTPGSGDNVDIEVRQAIANKEAGIASDGDLYTLELLEVGNADKAALKDVQDRTAPGTSNNTNAISEITAIVTQSVLGNITSAVAQRFAIFNQPMPTPAAEASGVAAGDESLRHGIWGTPFYSQAVQKRFGKSSGFKMQSTGAMLGFDNMLNDNLTAGMAVTMFHTDVKQKDQKSGDRAKVDTYMFSAYMLNEMQNNTFVQSVASFGTSKVRNNEHRRMSLNTTQIATGKYDSTSWSGEVLLGYNGKQDNIFFTPKVGIRYSRLNDTGYKEIGTSFQNLSVSKRFTDKFEVVVGGSVSMEANLMDVSLSPEVHGFLNYDVINKNPKVQGRLNGYSKVIESKSSKPAAAFFNVGTSVSTNYHMMEYGFGYDATLAKKFVGHTGTLKVRVNF